MRKRKKKQRKKRRKRNMKFSGTKKFSLNSKRIQNFVSRNKQTKQNTLSQETKKHKVSRNKETQSLKKQKICMAVQKT